MLRHRQTCRLCPVVHRPIERLFIATRHRRPVQRMLPVLDRTPTSYRHHRQ